MYQQKRLYQYRFLARIVIEANTPLSVGSGDKDIITNQSIIRDVNGLPFIPGTAIAGILRHAMRESDAKQIFGFQETPEGRRKRKEKYLRDGYKESDFQENIDEGSQIIFSSAHPVINKKGEVVEGLLSNSFDDKSLRHFMYLPIRQHVRINEKGASADEGKFDDEVVYKGTRFCFEVEMLSETEDKKEVFKDVLSELASSTIQIGSGTRSGLGEIKIIPPLCQFAYLNLKIKNHRDTYIQKSSSLNDLFWNNPLFIQNEELTKKEEGWTTYQLELTPEDFFLFGSGFGNDDANMIPVKESILDWSGEGETPYLKNDFILIPGSSIKGTLSHRVAYHYNKLNRIFTDVITKGLEKEEIPIKISEHVGDKNKAVRTLFGYTTQNDNDAVRGNILISDVIQGKKHEQTKTLNHVSIDRFTGGAIEGALFTEEVMYGKDDTYKLTFKVKYEALKDNDVKQAFEEALFDITEGMLSLGGGVNRGHGCFTGKIIENGYKEIKRNEKSK